MAFMKPNEKPVVSAEVNTEKIVKGSRPKNTKANRAALNKKPLTENQVKTRDVVLKSDMVTIMLPPTGDPKNIIIKKGDESVEYVSEGDPEQVKINGYTYYVPRGIMVEVPYGVANVLENQKVTMQYYSAELKKNFKYGTAVAQTFEN